MPNVRVFDIKIIAISICCLCLVLFASNSAFAQALGVELNNTQMSASGGMAGTSIARPQDVISAINGNPATLTQLRGSQFNFSGAWIGPKQRVLHGGSVPGLQAFSGGSEWPGSVIGNIGLSQEFTSLGRPVTVGLGLVGTAGAGAEFRDEPASNGASLGLSALYFKGGASLLLTDRLSIGGNLAAGTSSMDAPFVGTGAMATAYAMRGSAGLSYDVNPCTTIGAYYESESHYQFSRAIQLLGIGPFLDVSVDLPQTVGIGVANTSLLSDSILLLWSREGQSKRGFRFS